MAFNPPLWLSDPHQKLAVAWHIPVHVSIFLAVWYVNMGFRFSRATLVPFFTLLLSFGYLTYHLRTSVRQQPAVSSNKDKKNYVAFIHAYYGVPEAYLNMFPLLYATSMAVLDHFGVGVLPADPLKKFVSLWVCVYSIAHLLSAGSHTLYYDWFHKSGMDIAKCVGMGARGYNLYGCIPQSKIPRLTTNGFLWLSLIMTWNFYAALIPGSPLPAAFHFLVGFFMVLLRKSMLFAETSAGMHKPVLLPAVCWYLAFSPQLWKRGENENSIAGAAEWPMQFLKIHIVSTYFMAGIGKLIVTWMQGNWNWADSMQYYLFAAMFARPGANQCAIPRLRGLIQRPWACVLLGLGGLVFEVGCPVTVYLGGYWSILLFVVAVQFHYGIFYLQGIDFTAQWVPCLLVFLVDRSPVASLAILLPATGASWVELVCWVFASAHLLGQLFCAFTMREVTHAGDHGGMPFSCLHMFTVNSNIFGHDFCSWYTLMEGDQRASGHLGIMEWSSPVFRDFHMSQEDMMRLPFKAVWFGHTMCNEHNEFLLKRIVKDDYQQERFLVFSNFDRSDELNETLHAMCRLMETDARRTIRYKQALDELLRLQSLAQYAFLQCCADRVVHTETYIG